MDKKPRPTLNDIRPRSMDPVRPPRPVQSESAGLEPVQVQDKLDQLQARPAKKKGRLKKFLVRFLIFVFLAAASAALFWFYIKPTYLDF